MFLTGNFTSISFVDFKQIPFSIADGEGAPTGLMRSLCWQLINLNKKSPPNPPE